MIGLIKLTDYLLDQQLRQLEEAFVIEGGLRERMTRARLAERAKQHRRGTPSFRPFCPFRPSKIRLMKLPTRAWLK